MNLRTLLLDSTSLTPMPMLDRQAVYYGGRAYHTMSTIPSIHPSVLGLARKIMGG